MIGMDFERCLLMGGYAWEQWKALFAMIINFRDF